MNVILLLFSRTDFINIFSAAVVLPPEDPSCSSVNGRIKVGRDRIAGVAMGWEKGCGT